MATGALAPDMQHKMSKKIAQLTKVIYMLNTRNDEHQYELAAVSEAYEADIEQVTSCVAYWRDTIRSTCSVCLKTVRRFILLSSVLCILVKESCCVVDAE